MPNGLLNAKLNYRNLGGNLAMITFYPRDIGMWRGEFDFTRNITLTPKEKTDHKLFHDRSELIDFLKEHGVTLTDLNNPLTITGPENHPVFGPNTYVVQQWTVLGWLKWYG